MSIPRRVKGFIVALISFGVGGFAATYGLQTWSFREDFRRDAPEHVFQRVFGEQPPKGVMELHAAGRHYLTKQWIWMRLRVTPTALSDLIALSADVQPLSEPEASQEIQLVRSANPRYDTVDKQSVGWSAVAHLPRPEVYQLALGPPLSTGEPGWIWSGVMIVDRSRQTVYIHALGD